MLAARMLTPARFAATTKSMPRIMSLVSALPPKMLDEKTLTAIMRTFQFIPATPRALFPTAPIMPATCVPCPSTSPMRLISCIVPESMYHCSSSSPCIVGCGPMGTPVCGVPSPSRLISLWNHAPWLPASGTSPVSMSGFSEIIAFAVASSNVYMLFARSGWSYMTPLSITATTTSSEPVPRSQTSGAFIAAGPHCSRQRSSFGVTACVCIM